MSEDGVLKGAILMLALGEEEAAEVMKYLGPREVQKLGTAMSSMRAVPSEVVGTVLNDFSVKNEQNSVLRAGFA